MSLSLGLSWRVTAIQSELEMADREHHIRLLRGAICEYLDEGMLQELLEDLRAIAAEEQDDFLGKAKLYRKFRKLLPKSK